MFRVCEGTSRVGEFRFQDLGWALSFGEFGARTPVIDTAFFPLYLQLTILALVLDSSSYLSLLSQLFCWHVDVTNGCDYVILRRVANSSGTYST